MPFINLKTTKKITSEAEAALREGFGKDIEIIPGKTESWLMLGFEDNCRMAFSGKSEPDIAYVEVSLLGSTTAAVYARLTAAITKRVEDVLGVAGNRIYVKYEETEYWGWNGSNF